MVLIKIQVFQADRCSEIFRPRESPDYGFGIVTLVRKKCIRKHTKHFGCMLYSKVTGSNNMNLMQVNISIHSLLQLSF